MERLTPREVIAAPINLIGGVMKGCLNAVRDWRYERLGVVRHPANVVDRGKTAEQARQVQIVLPPNYWPTEMPQVEGDECELLS